MAPFHNAINLVEMETNSRLYFVTILGLPMEAKIAHVKMICLFHAME